MVVQIRFSWVVVAAIEKPHCEGSAAEPDDFNFDPAMNERCLAAISSITSAVMAWATLRLLYTILKMQGRKRMECKQS